MPDLLIELFSEEIPARMQARAAADLKRLITDGLVESGLTYASAGAFSTPRRLTLTVEGLTAHSPTTRDERKGPRTDAPEQAIAGFLRSTGLTIDQLERRADKKAEVFFAVLTRPGRPAADIVAEVLDRTIRNFPWPKSMRWGSGSLRWVRPLHSILCILSDEAGAQIVPLDVDGIASGNTTRGHRFMAPDAFAVTGFDDYADKLRAAYVMLDADERAQAIRNGADNLAFARGWDIVPDDALLAEVAGLVEWPVPLMGVIQDRFLDLPPEVLQTSMKEHQKFFSARNPKTGRIEGFVTVANIETTDDGAAILAGNQRVLAARLSDAVFFWENDVRQARGGMTNWADGLASVTFHAKLGSQSDRVTRIAALARDIAPAVGADPDQAEQAARIAKLDLRSSMVGEFPELQGVMGRYYALNAGQADAVADAARDHYSPLGPSDAVPTAPVSVAVALADKIDTLTGFWAIDEKPTGSKDPYALRRAALGVIRLVLGNGVRMPLLPIFAAGYPGNDGTDLLSFLHDRLKVHLRDQGVRHDVIDAVLAQDGRDDLTAVVARATALNDMLHTADGENLLQGLKRAANILGQAESADGVEYSFGADPKFAETDEERALFAALDTAEPAIRQAMADENYPAAMSAIAALRGPIDAFFTAVQVNTDNSVVRRNRLNLLHRIRAAGRDIADFSRIEG
ncbi:glycine--tRNA ligase subunit beta [Paracoccus sp. (in: a-proteobacteria)]|uniref:glycine--tRNA ligase subunit beta n=1 Tax=Paracoccus sp. TaxID=267 RepID=UPI0026DF35AF|nr:glycine--tRNA ligase subunit beta [Paracoccus sp. (in: a-proteobacteria)]MDO5646736.1 glycine--tRNA ligase subunit beta [Paracoccus sp. (in: a-proteobacteria)]